ncbi:SusC/RagA family TonB-linked outer membrane protein [Robertkochia solimangrovi]|uniref:SusC/RagA family TonB-linked outer membrane protein n=1 Tax=Robertkochia solimangrovi TaxID=2213046 RepID=UPI00117DFB6D|nr:TonB-dependent receptor [Robertkochia solimangrovi]TRZ41860.1 SusC/RagA family TonB-linked outer membrane protein [Robertkochia solimangrovi]
MKIKLCIVFLCLGLSFTWGQNSGVIKGTVRDSETGVPIPGASVQEVGTTNGTATDFDGNFSLNVSADGVIRVSYLGYESQEISVGGRSDISVDLVVSASELSEVIVTGYTRQARGEVTASVQTVSSEKLQDVTSPDVSTMLQGKASGVQVVQGSGQPGANPSITIRGITSMNGSVSPLWVVDGVIVHGTPNLAPNEIESISVLKDASATALYGSRGANGVVVVSTKSGVSGKTTVSVSSRIGVSKFNSGNFDVMNSAQLYNYYENFGNPSSIPDYFTPDLLNRDFNWLDNGTQDGVVQDVNLSMTGGTEKSKTYVSIGYFKEKGTLKGYNYDRASFRLNHEYKVFDNLTLKPKVAFNYEKTDDRQHSLYALYTYMPWDSPYDENGDLINPQDYQGTWYGRDNSNYLYDLQWNYGKNREFNLFTNFDIEYEIVPNLKFISTNSITMYYSDYMSYTDPASNSGLANNGQLYKSNAKRITNFTNQMLQYKNQFGDHSVSALVAYEYNDYKYQSSSATGYGIVTGTTILDNAATPGAVGGSANDYALQSVLFNSDYSYANRYMAQFSIRRDGASNFGENNQYGTFYSGSLGWNIHNENFFNVDAVDQLKLRASYGAVGNRPGSLYPQYDLYSLGNTYDGFPAPTPSQLGNDDLAWEKSYQTNIGIDTRFIDRLNFSAEYYYKDTSDLLYFVTLPSTSGYTGYWENVGGVTNKGFEASLDFDIFKGDASEFYWNIGGNIGTNKNEVTDVYEGEDIDRGTKLTRVGEDFNSWFMRKWLGVDADTGSPLWEVVDAETGERTSTTDYNAATKQIVGSASPDFYGGFSTLMSYKGFSLSANFAFVSGNRIYNSSRELYDADGAYPTYNQQVLADGWSRWEQPGDIATHPQLLYGGNNLSNKTSSRYLEDGSYIRLRNVRFGYTFGSGLISHTGIKSLELYVTGDNLWTITDYTGMDPEVGADGYSSTLYPVPKRIAFGLNLSF